MAYVNFLLGYFQLCSLLEIKKKQFYNRSQENTLRDLLQGYYFLMISISDVKIFR